MNILKHFIIFYFSQNILLFWILLIPELIVVEDYKKEILNLKVCMNIIKIILIGVPLVVYEAIRDNY